MAHHAGAHAARSVTRRLDRDPSLRVKHLKRWTLRSVVATDVLSRAVPWSRLILQQGRMPDDLNVSRTQRFAALLAPLVLTALVSLPFLVLGQRWSLAAGAGLLLALSLGLHMALLRCFARYGAAFAIAGWIFQQVHLCYSAATFGYCWLSRRQRGAQTAAR